MRFVSIRKLWTLAAAVFLLALSAVDTRAAIENDGNDMPRYVITHLPNDPDGSVTFFAAKNEGVHLTSSTGIADVVNAIRTDADGSPCIIQFGNEERGALHLSPEVTMAFSNSQQNRWGGITFTGNLNVAGLSSPTIRLDNDVAATNMANITVIGDAIALYMSSSVLHAGGRITGEIINNGTGTVTVAGDTTASVNGVIINNSVGTVLVDAVIAASPFSTVTRILNRSAGEVRISRGKVGDIFNIAGGTVTVDGGEVVNIENSSGGSVMIGGGAIGGLFTQPAIINSGNGTVTIYGSATVTSRAGDMGTINNNLTANSTITESGSIVISGGTVSNEHPDSGVAILSSSNSGGSVTVSGGTVNGGRGAAIRNVGGFTGISGGTVTSAGSVTTIDNVGGFTEIRGGVISNTGTASGGGAVQAIHSNTVSSSVPMLSISGTTNITSGGEAPTVSVISSEMDGNPAGAGVADITGGIILNTASAVDNTGSIAIRSINSRLSMSGTAKVASSGISFCDGGVISIIGSSSELYILGGNISNTADSNGVALTFTHSDADFFIGGSPVIDGFISLGCHEDPLIPNVITTGNSALAPDDKIYTIAVISRLSELQTIVKNGARAASNFAIVTVNSFFAEDNYGFTLAIDDNDIVAVRDTPGHTVTFDINGAAGTPPPPVSVVKGSTLGEFARPLTEAYIRDGFSNDGKWYRRGDMLPGGEWLLGNEFMFGTGLDGTPVNSDIVLILRWVPTTISIAVTDRETPVADPDDAAIFAAPINQPSGEFTIGPNPVDRSSGVVNFYRLGRRVNDAVLTIFDASGNVVNRVRISDDVGKDGRRIVGSWDLTDRRGRPVSEGAYLVRGSVAAANGTKENVSMILGVAR